MLFRSADVSDCAGRAADSQVEPLVAMLRHVNSHRLLLVTMVVLGAVLTGLGLCFVTPTYQAQAVLIVDSRRNKLADAEAALTSIVVDQYQTSLKSELELITSPDVARRVITSLHLLETREYRSAYDHRSTAERFHDLRTRLIAGVRYVLGQLGVRLGRPDAAVPRPPPTLPSDAAARSDDQDPVMQRAIAIFGKKFWAQNDPKSLTIRVGYRSESPQLAAAVTNAALKRYLAADEEVKAAAFERSEAWLQGRIEALRADLDAAEQAVESFRAEHGLATDRDRSPLQQQLLQLSAGRVEAEAALAVARSKLGQDRAGSASADVLASPLIQSLRQQETALAAEQAQLGVTLLPSHPSMLKINDQLAKLRAAIRTEVDRVGQSQGNDVRLAEFRLASINGQIAEIQAKIAEANSYDIKLRSLEARATAKQSILNSFTQRFDQDAGNPLTPPDSRVVSWATPPTDASSPQYGLVLVAGMLAFLFIGLGISILLERLRSGVDTLGELSDELGIMAAGLTVFQRGWAAGRGRALRAPSRAAATDLALTVRAVAHSPSRAGHSKVVLVTSALPGEGKSSTALSFARSISACGQRCLLVDGDIRKPTLYNLLKVPARPGLVELTLDEAPFGTVVRQVPGEAFDFLSPGRPTRDSLSPFTTKAFGQVIGELRQRYDVIVIDSAPVLIAAEALVLNSVADVSLILVKWRTTPRQLARKAVQLLSRSSAGTCLAVLSQVNLRRMRAGKSELLEARHRASYMSS